MKMEIRNENSVILMQYTGVKNVYEGDIVKTKYQKIAEVVWDNANACFATKTIDVVVKNELMYCLSDVEEIIGNKFENPKLLNQ